MESYERRTSFLRVIQQYDNFSADTQRALEAVARLQAKLKERGETPTQEKLSLLKIVLQSPLFHHILSLQQAQRKPLAKVEREHGCVGVGCIVNARKGAGIMSKKNRMLKPNRMSNQLT